MLLGVPESDGKEREYIVVSMTRAPTAIDTQAAKSYEPISSYRKSGAITRKGELECAGRESILSNFLRFTFLPTYAQTQISGAFAHPPTRCTCPIHASFFDAMMLASSTTQIVGDCAWRRAIEPVRVVMLCSEHSRIFSLRRDRVGERETLPAERTGKARTLSVFLPSRQWHSVRRSGVPQAQKSGM